MVLLPLAYLPFTYDRFVLPKLLLARSLVVILAVLLVGRFAVTRTAMIKRTPLDIPLLVLIASALLSTLFAENGNVAVFGTYTRYDGLLTLVTYAALFWLAVQTIAGANEAHGLIRALLAGGYAVSAIAIVQSVHDSLEPAGSGQMLASGGQFVAAFGSLGNPNVLGAFLALVIPLGIGELLQPGSPRDRILWANVVVVAGLALLLTFSRSAWLGAGAGSAVVLFTRRNKVPAFALLGLVVAAIAVVLASSYRAGPPGDLGGAVVARTQALFSAGSRAGIWEDSLHMFASRPLIGYGPDNVGLVFPRFQTGDWGLAGSLRQPIDKTHLELLQVGATQGLVGLAAYLLLLIAFVRCLWIARADSRVVFVAAGWLGYEIVVQLNFTALGAALPFWLFAAAAVTLCGTVRTASVALDRARAYISFGTAVAAAAVVALWGVLGPLVADFLLAGAVEADYGRSPHDAQILAAAAEQYGPRESVYAVEVGNVAFELDQWAGARSAYRDAAGLGTFNALVYRNLALADQHLGLVSEAREAARKAVELDRFDPANQALLAEFQQESP